jgi:1,4-alpha-glucan branching enzyme
MDFEQPAPSQGMGPLPHGSGTSFRVWAPNAEAVYVTGSLNGSSKTQDPLTQDEHGTWSADVPGARPGDEYKYRIVAGGKELLHNDPYAQDLTSSVGKSIIYDPHFDWGATASRLEEALPLGHTARLSCRKTAEQFGLWRHGSRGISAKGDRNGC